MKKLKNIIIGVLLILLSSSISYASGRTDIPLGEKIVLEASLKNGSYIWTIKDTKGNVLKTIKGTKFEYVFSSIGRYIINLQRLDDKTGEISNTKILINVLGNNSSITNDNIVVVTDPPFDANNVIHLDTKGGSVEVKILNIPDDFMEFRVDRDYSFDTNLDLDKKNDIDNIDDQSNKMGTPYTIYYEPVKDVYEFGVKILKQDQKIVKNDFKVVFDGVVPKEGSEITANLVTIPRPATDGVITLYDNKVVFNAELSEGAIKEYRIDTNIYFDSDGDGDPSNDIDNKDHGSVSNGKDFSYIYQTREEEIIAELTVLDQFNNKKRDQVKFVFGDNTELVADFVLDRNSYNVGDTIAFYNQSFSPNTNAELIYRWDFNGDNEYDLETRDKDVTYKYNTPGKFLVTLQVEDKNGGDFRELYKEVMVIGDEKQGQTIADFRYIINKNKVSFSDTSIVNSNLSNNSLTYLWDFGDTKTSTDKNPEHVYDEIGEYFITLKIKDSGGEEKIKTSNIKVEAIEETKDQIKEEKKKEEEIKEEKKEITDTNKDSSGKDNIILSILKYLGYFILIMLLLVGGIIVFGTIYIKTNNPDFSIKEAFNAFKEMALNRFKKKAVTDELDKVNILEQKKKEIRDKEEVIEPEIEMIPDWMKKSGDEDTKDSEESIEINDGVSGEVLSDQPAEDKKEDISKDLEEGEDLFGDEDQPEDTEDKDLFGDEDQPEDTEDKDLFGDEDQPEDTEDKDLFGDEDQPEDTEDKDLFGDEDQPKDTEDKDLFGDEDQPEDTEDKDLFGDEDQPKDTEDKDLFGDEDQPEDTEDKDLLGDEDQPKDTEDKDLFGDEDQPKDTEDKDLFGDEDQPKDTEDKDLFGDEDQPKDTEDKDLLGDEDAPEDTEDKDLLGDEDQPKDTEDKDLFGDEDQPKDTEDKDLFGDEDAPEEGDKEDDLSKNIKESDEDDDELFEDKEEPEDIPKNKGKVVLSGTDKNTTNIKKAKRIRNDKQSDISINSKQEDLSISGGTADDLSPSIFEEESIDPQNNDTDIVTPFEDQEITEDTDVNKLDTSEDTDLNSLETTEDLTIGKNNAGLTFDQDNKEDDEDLTIDNNKNDANIFGEPV